MATTGIRRPARAVQSAMTGTALIAALLLIPAGLVGGRWLWWRGLTLVAGVGIVALAGNLALALWRPASFDVRDQSVVAPRNRKQPLIDAIGSAALLGVAATWLVLIPIDVFGLRLLPPPTALVSAAGGVAALIGAALTPVAAWENRFATPNVQNQTADGHRVIDTGIYALVRHPIYLGNLLLCAGASLWLGSYASLWGAAVLLIATIGRIAIEERDLRTRLPSYGDYARRVRARLIPFLL